jgi:hypothetical protein
MEQILKAGIGDYVILEKENNNEDIMQITTSMADVNGRYYIAMSKITGYVGFYNRITGINTSNPKEKIIDLTPTMELMLMIAKKIVL